MSAETRSLTCVGLSAHEAATVRLVSTSLGDRLEADWRLGDQSEADVVVADPNTEAGRAALELASGATDVISLIDRNENERPPTEHYLYRPLRPAALVDLLNQAEFAPSPSDSSAATSIPLSALATGCSKTVSEALREAMRDAPIGSIDIIDGFGGELAIDIERDRLVGPIDGLDASVLTDATTYPVYRLYAPVARARSSGGAEMPLTLGLWRMLGRLAPDRALYGSPDRTPVWLTRWPRLPTSRLARRHLRAATALRHGPRTVLELAHEVGLETTEVLALCNGAWLTGDLEAAEHSVAETTQSSAANPPQRSLASRIRQRLGVT